MNESVFRWINNWPDALEPMFVFFSEATKLPSGKAVFLILAVTLALWGNKGRKALLLGLVALGLANEATDLIKAGLPMLRPCVELADVNLRVGMLTSNGTASAHSANMAALATTFCLVWGWRGTFWVPVALLTGLSRIYVGVHYPSQVLLGWTCGIAIAIIVVKGWDWIANKRKRAEIAPEAAASHDSVGTG